jgi:nucleoside-diphosphate-sugar epimerase
MSLADKIVLIGASSRIGRKLLARLQRRGLDVVAVGRSEASLAGIAAPHRLVDFTDRASLGRALADADAVVNCTPLVSVPAATILDALPERATRIVFTGSTRRFTRFPDDASAALAEAETRLAASGRPGIILHASMIIGEGGGRNVERIAATIRRFGIVPLPRRGNMLVQPIYTDDVAACLERALERVTACEAPLVIAGREAVSYRRLVEAVGQAIGRRARILPVPAAPLMAAASLTRILPFAPRIEPAEIRRLLEDKAFDISAMRARLGVEPIGLEVMLQRTFAAPSC